MLALRTILLNLSLVLILGSTAIAAESPTAARLYPPMPEAVTSFGAAVSGPYVYIFGGHMGRVAGNSKDGLSPHFARLDLTKPGATWEDLPMLESSQSPALVAWDGKIYRVGGLSFQNSASDPTSFRSLANFAAFDPQTKTWKELPPLPEPRSSLDAAVVDGKLYVVGGWDLQGEDTQGSPWHDDALVFDLADETGSWKPIATPPFQTRALAAASHDHKLYVMGGMKSSNETTNEVHIYDPATDQWSTGPELSMPGRFNGFASAAFGNDENLYYAGGSGVVYQLDTAAKAWKPIERLLFSRMFHRLVIGPSGELVVLGGVGDGRTYLSNVEAIDLSRPKGPKSLSWDVEFPGKARHSQSLLVNGSTLYAFGGNTSTAPHDFDRENFSNEAFAFQLATREVKSLAPLPRPVQSGGAFVGGTRRDSSIYVVGGLSPDGDHFGPTDVVQQYRLRSESWNDELGHLPAPRSMFDLVTHERSAWIFGGSAGKQLATDTWTWNPIDQQQAEVVSSAAIPTQRRSAAGAVLGTKYYAVGGLGEGANIQEDAYAYDFEAKTWSKIAAPKHSRVFAQLAVSGEKLYLSGGFSKVDGHFAGTTAIECYDPKTNTWESVFEELAPQLSKMRVMSYQDRLLFFSVDADRAGLAHFVLLDPAPESEGYQETDNFADDRTAGQELTAQLKSLDKNSDGQLSLDEVGERFQPLVKRIDTNKDGVASAEEIAAFTKKVDDESPRRPGGFGRDPAERVTRLIEENDADKDGLLKGDEIPERMRNNVERFDTNGDGALDKAELEAGFRSFRGGSRGGRSGPPSGNQPPRTERRSNGNPGT